MVEVEIIEDDNGPTREAVIQCLKQICDSLPTNQQSAFQQSVIPTLLTIYDNPPLHLIATTCPGVTTSDQFRSLLFFPTSGGAYARILTVAHQGAKPTSVQIAFLAMLYLKHIHGHDSSGSTNFDFSRSFIVNDGLATLATAFVHPNLHFRGQVIDSFLQLTSHTAFDWFAMIDPKSPTAATDRHLHQKLLDLATPIPTLEFLPSLLSHNSPFSPTTFPGGTFLSLQILGFWLSWIRALHTPSNALRLSGGAIQVLKEWANATVWGGKGDIANGEVMEEEKELASKLYADFGKDADLGGDAVTMTGHVATVPDDFVGSKRLDVNPLPEGAVSFIKCGKFEGSKEGYTWKKGEEGMGYYWDYGAHWGMRDQLQNLPNPPTVDAAAKKAATPPPPPAAKELSEKEKGNELFAKGDYLGAIGKYGIALAASSAADLDDDLDDPLPEMEPEDRAVLHANRAACYLKLVQAEWKMEVGAVTCEGGGEVGKEWLRLAEEEAKAAVQFNEKYAKGWYRRAQCVALRGDIMGGVRVAKEGIKECKGGKGVDELDEIVGALLRKLGESAAEDQQELGKEAAIMARILGRRDYGNKLREMETKEEKVEEKAEEGAVVKFEKKKSKKYEDDDSDVEDEVDGGKRPASGFEELDGVDSDDDDADAIEKKKMKQEKAKKKSKSKENVGRVEEDVMFVKKSNQMDDILTNSKRSKKEKESKKEKAKKAKDKKEGLGDVLKLAGGMSGLDFGA